MTAPGVPASRRWEAIQQAEAEHPKSPDRIRALERLVYERGFPAEFSNYAVDELIRIDPQQARKFFLKNISRIQDVETLSHLDGRIAENNWEEFIPVLVARFADFDPKIKDSDRSERQTLEKLRPDEPIDRIALKVFSDTRQASSGRAAAWRLIARLNESRSSQAGLLEAIQNSDPFIAHMQKGWRDLAVLPSTPHAIAWVQFLHEPAQAEIRQAMQEAVAPLTTGQRENLEPRHLRILAMEQKNRSPRLQDSREKLLADLRKRLDTARHHTQGPSFDGPMSDYPQFLGNWETKLSWGDLLTAHTLMDFLTDARAQWRWFVQADADLTDRNTEYGGLILFDDRQQPYPHLFEPILRRGDHQYTPPAEILTRSFLALGHYHFHAQNHRNRSFAGPGLGDLGFATRHACNCLVLTFIDADHLNADLYLPDGIVLDLGTLSRPAQRPDDPGS